MTGLGLVYTATVAQINIQEHFRVPQGMSAAISCMRLFAVSVASETASVFQRCVHGVRCMQLLLRPHFEHAVALRADTLADLIKVSFSSLDLR